MRALLIFFLVLARGSAENSEASDLAVLFVEEVGIGVLVGAVSVYLAATLFRFTVSRGWVTDVWRKIVTAALALVCFAATQWLGGSGLRSDDKLFIGWFGPRGLASIVFVVIATQETLPGGNIIGVTVAFTVLLSVIAHGITANPLSRAYVKRQTTTNAVKPKVRRRPTSE